MRGYTKADVEGHRVGYGGKAFPSVNVKAGPMRDVSADRVRERFGCSESTAEQALEFCWESACEDFWRDMAEDTAHYYLGEHVKVYQEGRSGGWLIVDNLPEVSEWDGVMLNSWALFERAARRAVDYLTSWEQYEEAILANEWAMDSDSLTRMLEEAAGGRVVPGGGTVYRRWGYGRLERSA